MTDLHYRAWGLCKQPLPFKRKLDYLHYVTTKPCQPTRWLFIALLSLFTFSAFSQKLYKTPSGAKYHLGNCHMVKNVSEEITLQQAFTLGLSPCRICKPEQFRKQPILPENIPQGKKSTVRCKGQTKSGSHCLHMTSIANGYCYQHNPDK